MMEKKKSNWWWPTITDQASAIEATKVGYWAAVVVAVFTAVVATIALTSLKGVSTISPWAYFDAVLFAIIAWRIKKYSKFFAVAGVALFALEKLFTLSQSKGGAGWLLAIVMLLMFISGARGVFAYHRFSVDEPEAENA